MKELTGKEMNIYTEEDMREAFNAGFCRGWDEGQDQTRISDEPNVDEWIKNYQKCSTPKYNNQTEIRTVINDTPKDIQEGSLVYIDKKGAYVRMFNKWIKYKWYHKLIGLKPKVLDTVSKIDASKFKVGDDIYLYLGEHGALTTKRH